MSNLSVSVNMETEKTIVEIGNAGSSFNVPQTPTDNRKQKLIADDPPERSFIDRILTIIATIVFIVTFPVSIFMAIKTCYEFERALIFRLGRLKYKQAKGPGVFFVLPWIESFVKVDLRTVSFTVPQQEILSKDSVTVEVDAVVYFKIYDPIASIIAIENATASTKLLAQTTLRNMLGTRTLTEMLQDRENLSHQMQDILDEATEPWGMKVERVEIKDIRLPKGMQRAMAAEAEAAREARAKVIAAEGERQSSDALREAALKMADSPGALQLRYLQTLNTISAERNSTIVFPFPIDMLNLFFQKDNVVKPQTAPTHNPTPNNNNFIPGQTSLSVVSA